MHESFSLKKNFPVEKISVKIIGHCKNTEFFPSMMLATFITYYTTMSGYFNPTSLQLMLPCLVSLCLKSLDPKEAPGTWLHVHSILAIHTHYGVNQQVENLSLSLSLFLSITISFFFF